MLQTLLTLVVQQGGGNDCFRLSFPVYFFDPSAAPGTTIEVQNLQISGTVSEGVVNEEMSDNCASNFNVAVSADGLSFTYTQSVPNLTVPVNHESANAIILFEVVVEAKPGALVDLDISEVSFTYSTTQTTCSLPQSAINKEEFNGHTMSTPAACTNANWELGFGDVDQDYGSTHITEIVPVTFSENLDVEEIDFQITITDLNGTLESVEVESGISAIVFSVESLGSNAYRVYAHGAAGTISLSSTEHVGEIYLHRPSLDNVAIDVELSYDYARIHAVAGECCSPVVNPGPGDTPYSVQVAGQDYCSSDFRVEIVPIAPSPSAAACTPASMLADYIVSVWNDGAVDMDFDFYNLEIKFLLTQGESLSVVSYDAPLCSNSCSGTPCFNIDPVQDKVSYVYCTQGGPFTLHAGSELSFVVRVEGGPDDCVSGAYFRDARLGVMSSGDICAPMATNSAGTFCFIPNGPIEGLIAKENGEGVEDVKVSFINLVSNGFPPPDCSATFENALHTGSVEDECGRYHFCSSCEGGYHIVPSKEDNPLCGVTTLDMVYITRHILGIALLDSPYKMIAADANDSHSISTLDLVVIQKLILLIYEDFPDNSSWRFVDASYDFPDPSNPWSESFPESVYVDPYDASQHYSVDFVAVKIGDVNLSCQVCGNGMLEEQIATGKITSYIDNQSSYQAGDTVSLPFYVKDFASFNSYQMGIGFDTDYLSYASVESADLGGVAATEGDDFNVDAAGGKIRTLWYDDQGGVKSLQDGDALFRLKFVANTAISDLTGKIWLADSILGNWAYDDSGVRHLFDFRYWDGVNFNTAQGSPSLKYHLQIAPNPFRDEVRVSVQLNQAEELVPVRMLLYDLSGRLLWQEERKLLAEGMYDWILPFGKYRPGIYLLRVECCGEVSYHRLMKQ